MTHSKTLLWNHYRTPWSGTDLSPQTGRPPSVQWSFCNKSVSSDTAVTALTTVACDVDLRVAGLHTPSFSLTVFLDYPRGLAQRSMRGIVGLSCTEDRLPTQQ